MKLNIKNNFAAGQWKLAPWYIFGRVTGDFYQYSLKRDALLSECTVQQIKPMLCNAYRQYCGYDFDIEDPKTFREKIQWLKLYDSTPLKTKCADKYLAKDYISSKVGFDHIVPTLGAWDSFDDINFDSLPNRFVLKANHGSGWNIIVDDRETFKIKDAKGKFDRWMKQNLAFGGGV